MILICLAIFSGLVLYLPYEAPQQDKWFIFSALSAVYVGWYCVRPKLGTFAALLFGYVVIQGAWFWVWKNNRYVQVQPYDQMALRYYGADAMAKLFIVLTPILFFLKDRAKLLSIGGALAAAFCLGSTGAVFYSFFFEGHWCLPTNTCGGSLSNPSMNSSMLVVTLPFVIDRLRGYCRILAVALVVVAVFLSKGSIGIGLLAALGCLYAVRYRMWKLLAIAPLVLLLGLLIFKTNMLNTGDRWDMWVWIMGKWANNPNHYIFGTGYGNFGVFSTNLQIAENFRKNSWWIWLHNDWLEILFTLGGVGLFLSLGAYLQSLWSYVRQKEHTEAISLALFGLTMCMNFPMHNSLSSVFGAWIVLVALLKTSNEFQEVLFEKPCSNPVSKLLIFLNIYQKRGAEIWKRKKL